MVLQTVVLDLAKGGLCRAVAILQAQNLVSLWS